LASWQKAFSGNNFVSSYFTCLVCIKTTLAAQSRASSNGIAQSDIDHSFGEKNYSQLPHHTLAKWTLTG